uniref:Uncharacterized protein n=1 Tax=Triticum urartu TaxID=4572 RepID=A0A8R7UAF2_TRIUA
MWQTVLQTRSVSSQIISTSAALDLLLIDKLFQIRCAIFSTNTQFSLGNQLP